MKYSKQGKSIRETGAFGVSKKIIDLDDIHSKDRMVKVIINNKIYYFYHAKDDTNRLSGMNCVAHLFENIDKFSHDYDRQNNAIVISTNEDQEKSVSNQIRDSMKYQKGNDNKIIIKWVKHDFDNKLRQHKDSYIYAVTEDETLIYIGKSTVENGIYIEAHRNSSKKEFGWNRKRIKIWFGYISYNGELMQKRQKVQLWLKHLIADIEKYLIYVYQPRDPDHYKNRYTGRKGLTIENYGCPQLITPIKHIAKIVKTELNE